MATIDPDRQDQQDATYDVNLNPNETTQSTNPRLVMADDNSDTEFALALAASRLEFNRKTSKSQTEEEHDINTTLSMSNIFTPLSLPDSDTLIYIGPPPRAPGQSLADFQYIEAHFRNLHRMPSQQLRDLGSSTFNRLLGPKSERSRRRFGKEGLLTGINTENIKYYIDLRPAEEGDEAVELVTDLTCTPGILNWYKAKNKYSIALSMVSGRDHFESPLDQFRNSTLGAGAQPTAKTPLTPEVEYSALRHRSAIERVLQAIAHNDPKLDSAPKMWTFFQVAKHLDVARHERVSGWITKWLYLHPNSNFIQSNPEVVYRIGLGTMSVDMIRDGLSMLAGEKALIDSSDASLRLNFPLSVHGRPLEILDDDERNRIDHAAASLHARIQLKFKHLVDQNMDWLKQSFEYRKLMSVKPKDDYEKKIISSAEEVVKDYVRGRILWVLARNPIGDPFEFDKAMADCREFREGVPTSFHEIYEGLSEQQRLLTRTLWIALQNENIAYGHYNNWTPVTSANGTLHYQLHSSDSSKLSPIGDKMIKQEMLEPGSGIKVLDRSTVLLSIEELNTLISLHKLGVGAETSSGKQSTVGSKYNPIDIDAEDNNNIEIGDISQAQTSPAKRRRISIERPTSSEVISATSVLPLRVRNPDPENEEMAASGPKSPINTTSPKANKIVSQSPGSSSSYRAFPTTSSLDFSGSYRPNQFSAKDFDANAKLAAERSGANSWTSFDRTVFVRADASYSSGQNTTEIDTSRVWVAKADPFNALETTTIITRQKGLGQPGSQKRYWRATTCQLYCKVINGRIVHVREEHSATPSLAEASFRIQNPDRLQSYILAYNTYARQLAEILPLPYWVALNGDMYLRCTPNWVSGAATVWTLASTLFDTDPATTRQTENGIPAEHWTSPSGSRFRRRLGRIELYTEGPDEPPPVNSASILASPLTISTDSGITKIAPHARFVQKWPFPDMHDGQTVWSVTPPTETPPPGAPRYVPRPATPPPAVAPFDEPTVSLTAMLSQFSDALHAYCHDVLHPEVAYGMGGGRAGMDPVPRDLMDTLMCLGDEEWKYLPLWAGGNDDGTGGVFDEADVPNLEGGGGFKGGKRGLGSEAVDGRVGGEDAWSEIGGSEAVSTLGRASKLATDGTETVKSVAESEGFAGDDDLYRELQNIRIAKEEAKNKGKQVVRNEEERDEDQVTVMGAASDIQGDLFGDVDDDNDDEDEDREMAMAVDGSDDDADDFELLADDDDDDDDDDDAFVSIAKD